jgi:hypothetical protein
MMIAGCSLLFIAVIVFIHTILNIKNTDNIPTRNSHVLDEYLNWWRD